MKKQLVLATVLSMAYGAFAGWTYDFDTHVISVNGWELNTDGNANGLTISSVKTAGGATLDLSVCDTPDAPAIIAAGQNCIYGSKNRSALVELILPDTMLNIGHSAFRECKSLTTVRMPAYVQNPGSCGFMSCTALKTVTPFLPPTITSLDATFYGCSSLTGDLVVASQSITEVASQNHGTYGAFNGTKITSVDLSESSISLIQPNSFRTSTIKWVKFPASLTRIESAAFYGTSALVDVSFLSFPTIDHSNVFGSSKGLPARFTYPANNGDWAAHFANLSPTLWAEAGSKTNDYLNTFSDGLTPVGYATYYPSINERTYSTTKWFVPVPVVSTDKRLGIQSYPVYCGEPVPGYGDQGVITEFPTTCTAPAFAALGDKVYRCIGYEAGKLVDTEIVYDPLVPSLSYDFNPQEAGDYYVRWVWEVAAYQVDATRVPEGLGSVVVTEDVFEGFTGFYEIGTNLTITATGAADAPFVRWYGDVPVGHETDNPLAMTVDKPFSVRAYFAHDWTYADEHITDGYWTLSASGPADAITIGNLQGVSLEVGMLDFRKPVRCDQELGRFVNVGSQSCYQKTGADSIINLKLADTITNISASAFRDLTKLKTVQLPTGLKFIGDAAFMSSKMETVIPLLPPETIVDTAVFYNCVNMKGDLVLQSREMTELKTHPSVAAFSVFYRTAISSAELVNTRIWSIGKDCFRECPNLGSISLPRTVTKLTGSQFYGCPKLTNVVFRSFPVDGFPADSFGYYPNTYTRRIVYPAGNEGWEQYIADHASSFVPWDQAGDKTNTYLQTFNDGLKPVGHLIHDPSTTYGYCRLWMVPQPKQATALIVY